MKSSRIVTLLCQRVLLSLKLFIPVISANTGCFVHFCGGSPAVLHSHMRVIWSWGPAGCGRKAQAYGFFTNNILLVENIPSLSFSLSLSLDYLLWCRNLQSTKYCNSALAHNLGCFCGKCWINWPFVLTFSCTLPCTAVDTGRAKTGWEEFTGETSGSDPMQPRWFIYFFSPSHIIQAFQRCQEHFSWFPRC